MNIKDVGNGEFILNSVSGLYSANEISLVDQKFGTDVKFQSANDSFGVSILAGEYYPEIHIKAHRDVLLHLARCFISAAQHGCSYTGVQEAAIIIKNCDYEDGEYSGLDSEVINENT